MSASKPRIENDTIAAALMLAISFVALFLVAAILHPQIIGMERDDASSSSSSSP